MKLDIRLYRISKEMTQKEVADKVGITVQTISKYERDIGDMKMSTLIDICEVIGAPPEEIVKGYSEECERHTKRGDTNGV